MVVMVSDVTWVRRGVAKNVPDKVKLDASTLKELIQGDVPETTDAEADEDDEEMEGEQVEGQEEGSGDKKTKPKKGLRGTDSDDEVPDEGDMDDIEQYVKDYDKEDPEGNAMKGIAAFASNLEDPYMKNQDDSEEEEELEDFHVKADDNMVAVAKIDKEDYSMEVYIYNEANTDWYVHHDYILDAPPICLESVRYDPGNDEGEGKGNLMAVGTMESTINIWDLDIVNAVEPVVVLGTSGKDEKKRRKKRDGSAQGHTDAVLCLGWNRLMRHVLASGGADKTVVLWDLDQAKAAQIISSFDREVQCLQWHPAESTIFMAGTMGGEVSVVDCRNVDAATPAKWTFEGQIEKVVWDHFNPFCAFVAADDGFLRYVDSRNPTAAVYEQQAHAGGCSSVSLSLQTRGLLATVGMDEDIAVWKLGADSLVKVHSQKLSLGPLHSISFCPESPSVVCVGGEANDLVRTVDLATMEQVMAAFSE